MRVEDVVRAMEPWRAVHRRTAWRPVVLPGLDGAGLSHFGGLPYLPDGQLWPGCGLCWGPLTHALQLNLAEIPAEARVPPGRGLLQVFYCDAACLYDWERNGLQGRGDKATLVRIVEQTGQIVGAAVPGVRVLPCKAIAGWNGTDDYPSVHDHESLGLVYEYLWEHHAIRLQWPCGRLAFEWIEGDEGVAEALSDARPGDKLRGWPAWVRFPWRPDCPECGEGMDFVIQLETCGIVPVYFGGAGRGYVWQCPTHPEALSLSFDA